MSTSERRAVAGAGAPVRAALWVAMAIAAAAGIYGAWNGANPGLTLMLGIGVGVLWVMATRQRGGDR
jgi:hypothetical protein